MNRFIRFLLRAVTAAALIFVAAVLALWMLPTGTAFAVADPDLPAGGADGTIVTISAPIVTFIVAALIPLLNGLLTRATTSSGVKGLLTLVLTLVSSLITTGVVADGTAVFGGQMFLTWALGFVVAVTSYLGVYRPMGVTSSAIDVNGVEVAGRLANVGVKSTTTPEGI